MKKFKFLLKIKKSIQMVQQLEELMDDINKGIGAVNKAQNYIRNKKKKKKNFSLGDNVLKIFKKILIIMQ